MRIGVIGAGSMGVILARHLAKLGHQVSIANSKGPESLTVLGPRSARRPFPLSTQRKPETSPSLQSRRRPSPIFRGRCLQTYRATSSSSISATTIPSCAMVASSVDHGMLDSQWVAQQIGHPVIKAFNNIFAKSLLEKGVPRGTRGRIALSVAGDSSDAKAAVLRLVDDLGFDPVDGGDLDDSWRQQPGTPAYCQDLRPRLSGARCPS